MTLFVFFSTKLYATECEHTEKSFRCLQYLGNYDGDTITFHIPNVHPLLGDAVKIRINGIDTPEIRGSRPCEKELAIYTRDFVASLLNEARSIELKDVKRGKYFRIIGELWFDGTNLKSILLRKKLAIPYDGRKKTSYDWCQ